MVTRAFDFAVAGNKLNGLLRLPAGEDGRATAILVHGYGKSDIKHNAFYRELSERFARIGLNTYVWDKPGCGESEGTFDIDQPVADSAAEVVAAVRALRATGVAGTDRVGLWGISRAGWIAPIAMRQEPAIAFWISVSGPDDKENFRYLLESNFPIEGRSPEQTRRLVAAWQNQFNAVWQGGTFADAVAVADNFYADPFIEYLGIKPPSEASFKAYQEKFQAGEFVVDAEAELMVYVPDFRATLQSIDRPVLALFGERDANIDWRKTKALYQETIGRNPAASLDIRTFPDANHNLKPSATGSYREMLEGQNGVPHVAGYYQSMIDWLVARGFGRLTTTPHESGG